MRLLLLRPPVLFLLSSSGAWVDLLCRSGFSTLTMKRRPGEVGLLFLSAIVHPSSSATANAICLPSARLTYAFFPSERLPSPHRVRRVFPLTFTVRTPSTL